MNKVCASLSVLITCVCVAFAADAKVYVPEPPTKQEAVYDAAGNFVTVTAVAPLYTEFDWETYDQELLPYISYILVERHIVGTPWGDDEELGRVASVVPGAEFSFVDRNVVADCKYEYRLTCFVDETSGYSSFASVYTGVTPGAVTAFSATTADHLATAVDFSVTAPLNSEQGVALTSALTIEIQDYADWTYTTIHVIENVAPGATVTWQLQGLATGSYHYRAVAKVGSAGVGEGRDADVYVGLDIPGVPENLTCEPAGMGVRITWDAPARGGRGGSYNPGETTYTVTRRFVDGTTEVAGEKVKECGFVDNPGFDEEASVTYSVVAVNAAGESMKEATHVPVSVGAPVALPFRESFAATVLAHRGWMLESSQDDPYYTYEAWEFAPDATMFYFPTDEYLVIEPHDGDGGIASCRFFGYSADGQTESLISPRIATEGVDAVVVKFWFYDVCSSASMNVVGAAVSRDGGEWEELFVSEPSDATQPGWREVSLPVSLGSKCGIIRVRIDAVHHDGPITNVYIDEISVTDASVGAVAAIDAACGTADAEYFTLQGLRVAAPETPGIYIVRRGEAVTKVVVR